MKFRYKRKIWYGCDVVRIMHISCQYGEKMAGQLHEQMLRDGEDSVVYYGYGELPNIPKTFRFNSEIELKLYDLLARLTGTRGCFARYPTFLLKRRIREFRPELIHIHGLSGNYIHYYKLLTFLKDRKYQVVLTAEDSFLLTGAADSRKKEAVKSGKVVGNQGLFDGFDRLVIAVPDQALLEQFETSYLKSREIRLITSAEGYRALYQNIRQKTAEQYYQKMYAGD